MITLIKKISNIVNKNCDLNIELIGDCLEISTPDDYLIKYKVKYKNNKLGTKIEDVFSYKRSSILEKICKELNYYGFLPDELPSLGEKERLKWLEGELIKSSNYWNLFRKMSFATEEDKKSLNLTFSEYSEFLEFEKYRFGSILKIYSDYVRYQFKTKEFGPFPEYNRYASIYSIFSIKASMIVGHGGVVRELQLDVGNNTTKEYTITILDVIDSYEKDNTFRSNLDLNSTIVVGDEYSKVFNTKDELFDFFDKAFEREFDYIINNKLKPSFFVEYDLANLDKFSSSRKRYKYKEFVNSYELLNNNIEKLVDVYLKEKGNKNYEFSIVEIEFFDYNIDICFEYTEHEDYGNYEQFFDSIKIFPTILELKDEELETGLFRKYIK